MFQVTHTQLSPEEEPYLKNYCRFGLFYRQKRRGRGEKNKIESVMVPGQTHTEQEPERVRSVFRIQMVLNTSGKRKKREKKVP